MTYQTWPVLALKSMPDMLSMSFTKIGGLKPMPCHACKKLRCHFQFLVGLSHVSHLFCDILLISIAIKSNDEYFQSPRKVKSWSGATLAQARIVTSMSIQGPFSLYIIHGHHIGQKEIRYIFFYSCSKGDTCQFRHEPAALTNETVSARSWRVKRWKEQSSKKCLASWGDHDHERRARDKERERRGKEWGVR